MAGTMISGHIPDPALITWYSERGQNVFSLASPWTKFATLLLLVLLLTLTSDLIVVSCLYLAVLIAYALAGLPLRKLFSWSLIPLVFVLSLVGLIAWFQPGTPLWSFVVWGRAIALTDRGAQLVLLLSLKALASFTFTLLFVMTTRYAHLAGLLQRLFPSPLDQIFLLAYRFLFLALQMIDGLLKAVRSRGGGLLASALRQWRMFGRLFAAAFIRALERAERVERAMTARGYRGTLVTGVQVPAPDLPECAFLLAFSGAILLLEFGGLFPGA